MKKLILSIALLVVTQLFGLVWSEDPSITEEERIQRRELNQRIKNRQQKGSNRRMPIRSRAVTDENDEHANEDTFDDQD